MKLGCQLNCSPFIYSWFQFEKKRVGIASYVLRFTSYILELCYIISKDRSAVQTSQLLHRGCLSYSPVQPRHVVLKLSPAILQGRPSSCQKGERGQNSNLDPRACPFPNRHIHHPRNTGSMRRLLLRLANIPLTGIWRNPIQSVPRSD